MLTRFIISVNLVRDWDEATGLGMKRIGMKVVNLFVTETLGLDVL